MDPQEQSPRRMFLRVWVLYKEEIVTENIVEDSNR